MACIINTFSGKQIDIENPNPDNILIEDIAHALSFICRGCGQVQFFFPVARHCVYCALEAKARGFSDEVVFACLLHDASEAYMMDLPKPLKDALLPSRSLAMAASVEQVKVRVGKQQHSHQHQHQQGNDHN